MIINEYPYPAQQNKISKLTKITYSKQENQANIAQKHPISI